MSVIPHTIQFIHRVSWAIKNFDFRPRSRRPINSPKFEVRTLDVTTFSFTLLAVGRTHPSHMQFAVNLDYDKSRNLPAAYVDFVNFTVSLVDKRTELIFKTKGAFVPSSSPTSGAVDFVPLDRFSEDRHLQVDSTLLLVIELNTTSNQRHMMASIYNDELLSLGSCLVGMLETSRYSDMVVQSLEGVPTKVHECVLRARCPVLFSESAPDTIDFAQQPSPVWYSKASTPVLKTLLYYIYGRIVIHVPSNIKAELLAMAIRYELSDLERNLVEYPVELNLKTEIVVEEISFKHSLGDAMWKTGFENQHRIRFLPTKNLRVPDLAVSWEVKTKTDGEKYLSIIFEFSKSVMNSPVLMNCRFSLLGAGGRVIHSKDYDHLFVEEDWAPSPPFYTESTSCHQQPHCMKCQVRISEMMYEHLPPSNICRTEHGPCILFNDVSLIGRDLLRLFVNREHCDLKMEVGDRVFFGHKSFLANRSSMIKETLENLEGDPIEEASGLASIQLEDVDPVLCEIVLAYMYLGKLDTSDPETARALIAPANYFQLSNLFDKCMSLTT